MIGNPATNPHGYFDDGDGAAVPFVFDAHHSGRLFWLLTGEDASRELVSQDEVELTAAGRAWLNRNA